MSKTIPKTTNLTPEACARMEAYASRRSISTSSAIRELAELGLAADALHEAHLAALESAHELFGERLAAVEERVGERIDRAQADRLDALDAKLDVVLDRLDRIRDALRAAPPKS